MDVIAEARQQWINHGWDDAAPGMEAAVALVRAHQIILGRVERTLRPYDLTFARFEILRLLAFTQRGSMAITRLSHLLQVHSTSITNGVERLEDQGFVSRQRRAGDRRRVYATLTPRGRLVVERATCDLNESVFADVGITASQQELLWTILKAFRANAGDFAPASTTSAKAGRSRSRGRQPLPIDA